MWSRRIALLAFVAVGVAVVVFGGGVLGTAVSEAERERNRHDATESMNS